MSMQNLTYSQLCALAGYTVFEANRYGYTRAELIQLINPLNLAA